MPMDFKTAGGRVRSLIASKKPQDLAQSALTRDVLRDNIIDENIPHSPRFQAAANQTPTVDWHREQEDGTKVPESFKWSNFGDAVRDVARAAYQYDEPEIRPRAEMRPSALFNREVVSRAIKSPDFQEARPYTRDHADEALFGAQHAAYEMIERAPEVAEHLARAEQMREQEEELDDAQNMIDELREQAKAQHNEITGIEPDLVQQVKDQVARRQAAKGALEELLAAHQASGAGKVAGKVAKAAAKALGEAVELMGLMSLLPGCEPGSPHNRTPGQQVALAEKLVQLPQLQEILRIVGRLVNDMRFKRSARSRNVAIEPIGITTGQEITRLLPHELGRMQIPALRPLWVLDWAARSLLEWEMGGKEPAGKGPIIPVMDGSGSMDGDKFVWATALMLALLTLAQREKRDFAGVEFGWRGELKSWIFPGRETPDPERVIDMATHFFNGGTDITLGLVEAKRIIDTVPAFKTADVIILSDGADRYDAEDVRIVHDLNEMGVRIHGISILAPGNTYLQQACEYVVDVAELLGSNEATDALAENIT